MTARQVIGAAALLMAAACGSDQEISTADLQEAAKARVRAELGLSEQSALFTNVFVGNQVQDDRAVCGTVAGRRADGTAIQPRRFIAALDPARWVKFEPAEPDLPTNPDKFLEWQQVCGGEAEL